MLRQPGILPTYFLMFLSTIPVAPMMTGMTSTSCSIISGSQSGDLHTCLSSLWPSSGCCSHLEWRHL